MADTDKQMHCAMDLFRRLPPAQLETNLTFVSELVPDLADELLQNVDCPLKVKTDTSNGKDYLICDYNRDGDSYRSPYSNKYFPDLEDGVFPPEHLRKYEIQANELFQQYADQYYEGGIANAYFWDTSDEGDSSTSQNFAGAIMFKKDGSGLRGVDKGVWDSIHVVDVKVGSSGKTATYELTTTIILSMATEGGGLDLSGSIQRQTTKELKFDQSYNSHLVNIGNLIQDMENSLRDKLQSVYFDKAREITGYLRSKQTSGDRKNMSALNKELMGALINRKR
jgi:capping protein beta